MSIDAVLAELGGGQPQATLPSGGTYTYLACDLLTNAVLAELPLKAVTATSRLNTVGTFQGELDLQGASARTAQALLNATQENRTALYVDRDGVLLWGGIIWSRGDYKPSAPKLTLQGSDFFGYFGRRRIRDQKVYAAVDQLAIVRDLLAYAQGKPGGNIGVVIGGETSGVLRDRTYDWFAYKKLSDAITELSALRNGFDFAIDVAYDQAGNPQKYLHLSYPRRGRANTGYVFEFADAGRGNVVDYGWPEDGSRQANSIVATGAGSGATTLISAAVRQDRIDAGYPLLEEVNAYGTVSAQATLDAHAIADVEALADPVTIPELTVRADMDPIIGTYVVGDDALVRIVDPIRFPQGVAAGVRITGWDITPPDAGQAESVKLYTGPTGQHRVTHQEDLRLLMAGIFRRIDVLEHK